MRLLVIKNGNILTENKYYIYNFINKITNIQSIYLGNYDLESLLINFDRLIILGGPQTLTRIDKYPYLEDVIKLINIFYINNKHVLGICLGCQLIAKAFGCNVKKLHKPVIGTIENININVHNKLTKKLYNKRLLAFHSDYIVPNKKIDVLASHNHNGINIPYVIKKGNVVGIQAHVEMKVLLFIMCFNEKCHNMKKEDRNKILKDVIINSNKIEKTNHKFFIEWAK